MKQQNTWAAVFSSMDFIWLLMLCISVAPFSLCPRALYVSFFFFCDTNTIQFNGTVCTFCSFSLPISISFSLSVYLELLFFVAFALSGKSSMNVVVGVASQLLYYALDLLWGGHAIGVYIVCFARIYFFCIWSKTFEFSWE